VIYVSVGTHHQAFDRLLGALAPLAEFDELVVQHGCGAPPGEAQVAIPFLSVSEVFNYMKLAQAVVTHAGVGSFLMARRAGHVPVMVPRLRRYGEHVDDHQVELARALEGRGDAVVVWDMALLAEAVHVAPARRPRLELSQATLTAAVGHALDGDAVAPALEAPAHRSDAGVDERVCPAPYPPAQNRDALVSVQPHAWPQQRKRRLHLARHGHP
jgi:UDP-N-acetylglucosamine transferase subunit ALG13